LLRLVTLGNPGHPLCDAALAVIRGLPWVEHVGHLKDRGERPGLDDPDSAAFLEFLAELRPDVLVSVAYGHVLHEPALSIPTIGAINVHPSLLPQYRGAQAIFWALYEGQTTLGVTVHEMILPVDAGAILAQEALAVDLDDHPLDVYRRIADLSKGALRDALEAIRRTGRVEGRPQVGPASYRSDAWKEYDRLVVDWRLPGRELARRSRLFMGAMNIPIGPRRIMIDHIEELGSTSRRPGTIIRRGLRTWDAAAGDGTSVRLYIRQPLKARAKLLEARFASLGRLSRRAAPPKSARTRQSRGGRFRAAVGALASFLRL
jgi:methionyl-tRNA formyltransferase